MKKKFLICMIHVAFYANAQKNDSVDIVIKNVGQQINSAFEDYAPVISADGSIMIFTSRRAVLEKEIKKQKPGMENVYSSESKNNKWQLAKALSISINEPERNNSAIAISNDGQHLLLYRDDIDGNGDIWESFLKGNDWSESIKMPEPINSAKHESSASISPDGNTIYFVSDRDGGFGERDIWYSTKDKNGDWGSAQNIGSDINSKDNEEGVFIHPDGKTLYFSSTGHGGVGQYDIFKSVFEKGKWSNPENIGEPINTPENDVFFVMAANGKTAYYSSTAQKENFGKKDIYEINFTYLKKKKNEPHLTLFKGVVIDYDSFETLGADMEITDNDKNEIIAIVKSNSISGKFLVSLPAGKNYGIAVKREGYLFYSENFNIPDTASYKVIDKHIPLQKLNVGNKITLKNIFYDYDKTSLRTDSYIELTNLLNLLQDNSKLTIEIAGHTDNRGSAIYNKNLSEGRAHAVVSYLISKGIEIDRLRFVGYGLQFPIATNDTEEGRQLNRRVEFKVISN